jgi:hypothetical protein
METVFKVIALVCSVQVPHAECTFGPEKPGVAVYELTELKPKNELECGRDAQFLMAGLALKPGRQRISESGLLACHASAARKGRLRWQANAARRSRTPSSTG